MELSKRVWLTLTGVLSAALAAVVIRDIFLDYLGQGKPLWSTLIENALPLAAVVAVFLAGVFVYRRRNTRFLSTVTRWQYVGALGIGLIAIEVVGLQIIQQEIKPYVIIAQLTIGGAVAGTLVGYANARSGEAEAEIRRERDKFGALFDNAPAESVEVTMEGERPVLVETNPAFDDRFGTDGASPTGRSLFDVVSHDESTQRAIEGSIRSSEGIETELHAATNDGQRDYQLRVVPFGSGPHGYLLYTDITALKQAQAELESTVSRLEKSNERLQQFAYVASHDLQEPARMVSSYVSLLDEEYSDRFDEDAREYMDFAIDGANRMQAMIDGLLDYSRVRTNAKDFTRTDVDEAFSDTMKDLELLRRNTT